MAAEYDVTDATDPDAVSGTRDAGGVDRAGTGGGEPARRRAVLRRAVRDAPAPSPVAARRIHALLYRGRSGRQRGLSQSPNLRRPRPLCVAASRVVRSQPGTRRRAASSRGGWASRPAFLGVWFLVPPSRTTAWLLRLRAPEVFARPFLSSSCACEKSSKFGCEHRLLLSTLVA